MGPQQVLRAAACAVLIASRRRRQRGRLAQAARARRGDRSRSRRRRAARTQQLADAVVAAGLEPVLGDGVEDALAGVDASIATRRSSRRRSPMREHAFGALDVQRRDRRPRRPRSRSGPRARPPGLAVPELPRAWTYVLLCADRDGRRDAARCSRPTRLRALGGSPDVDATLLARYPEVDAVDRIASSSSSTSSAEVAGADRVRRLRASASAAARSCSPAGEHVIAAAAGARRGYVAGHGGAVAAAGRRSRCRIRPAAMARVAARVASWNGQMPSPDRARRGADARARARRAGAPRRHASRRGATPGSPSRCAGSAATTASRPLGDADRARRARRPTASKRGTITRPIPISRCSSRTCAHAPRSKVAEGRGADEMVGLRDDRRRGRRRRDRDLRARHAPRHPARGAALPVKRSACSCIVSCLLVLDARAAPARASAHAPRRIARGPHRASRYEPGPRGHRARARRAAPRPRSREIQRDLVDLPDAATRSTSSSCATHRRSRAVAPEGRGAPPWAIGVAYPDLGVISVATRRGGQLVDPTSTLRHELAHIALGAALGDRAPHWLHEGFAYQHSAEWSWDRTETLAGMAWFGGIVPLDELDASFPAEESPANRAYAESYDFVGYLSRRGRWEDTADDGDRWPFRRFLTLRRPDGTTLDAAAMQRVRPPAARAVRRVARDALRSATCSRRSACSASRCGCCARSCSRSRGAAAAVRTAGAWRSGNARSARTTR